MLLQQDKSDFIISTIKWVMLHEAINHWTLLKNNKVNNKHKNKYGKIKTILSIWYFKRNILPEGRLMKHTYRLCSHRGMQQWGIDYWETYAPVVSLISVRSLLIIAIIHEFSKTSIEFVLAFTQDDIDVDVFMEAYTIIY